MWRVVNLARRQPILSTLGWDRANVDQFLESHPGVVNGSLASCPRRSGSRSRARNRYRSSTPTFSAIRAAALRERIQDRMRRDARWVPTRTPRPSASDTGITQ